MGQRAALDDRWAVLVPGDPVSLGRDPLPVPEHELAAQQCHRRQAGCDAHHRVAAGLQRRLRAQQPGGADHSVDAVVDGVADVGAHLAG